jgi:antitoxin PrlF
MITSKLKARAQTTIQKAAREALRLKQGNEIAYSIDRDRAILTKAQRVVTGDPFAIVSEWDSDADHRAYGEL